jgi:hypothetical protein
MGAFTISAAYGKPPPTVQQPKRSAAEVSTLSDRMRSSVWYQYLIVMSLANEINISTDFLASSKSLRKASVAVVSTLSDRMRTAVVSDLVVSLANGINICTVGSLKRGGRRRISACLSGVHKARTRSPRPTRRWGARIPYYDDVDASS